MTTKKLLSLAFALLILSFGAKASSLTLSAGTTVYASNTPLTGLSSGDTLYIKGTLVMDAHYTNYSSNTLVVVISGSSASIAWNSNSHFTVGSGSKFIINNGGNLTNTGACNTNRAIVFGTSTVGSCNGAGGVPTFPEIVAAGGIATDGSPLPVTWLTTEAKEASNNEVQINWSTASETNNSHFEIEISVDGQNWYFAGFQSSLAENGMSSEILNYSYTHTMLESVKAAYFRIKQVDFDGAFEYSPTMRVAFNNPVQINISTLGDNKITVNTGTMDNGTVNIYDLSGNLVYSSKESNPTITLDYAGVYVIELEDNYNTQRVKHLVN